MPLDDMIMSYVQMAGLSHLVRLNDHWFKLDKSLVSAFVEIWRRQTHTFHLPFGECMFDDQYVSGCLTDFEWYIEGGPRHGLGLRSCWE
ncbi:uncharacterized protein DS421_16g550850 [Arachis hypogaea]|nr:uncharacterized protein DS421_16g550850 [Arachis hypogaea]